MKAVSTDHLASELLALPHGTRHLIGIAGPPGAGKSTLAEALATRINAAQPDRAAVLGMDGFHFDDRVLDARGHRPRKGAPHTFDVAGLASLLARLRAGEADVAVPVFDRSLEIARAGAAIVPAGAEVILVEGNYLLTTDGQWAALRDAFDLRVMIAVDRDELVRRLTARWEGFGLPPTEIATKLDDNDIPNGDYVRAHSVAIDRLVGEG